MEFVNPCIRPIYDTLMGWIREHLDFFISSTENVKVMNSKMKELNLRAKEVQSMLVRAKENTEVVQESVEPWLEAVKDLNQRTDLINATGFFNVAKRYDVGKQSYDILQEIKDLEDQGSKIEFTHAQKPLAEVGSTSAGPSTSAPPPMGNQNNFKSREMIFNEALQSLKSDDESHKMIALCGMGGVGKTTMMEDLKRVVESSKVFTRVVKVVIGEEKNPTVLQRLIAERIFLKDLPDTTVDARADRLHQRFEEMSQKGQNKILVIMDDLWNEIDLKDVGLSPLPNGIKLLLTSRYKFVCIRMGVNTDSILIVGFLSDTEAKSLFYKTVGGSPSLDDDVELQRIGESIVKKCGGLPIAIVTIGKHLRGNIKEAWEEALSNLQHFNLQHHDLDDMVHRVFKISYDNLKTEDDKAVFILSGLFPDDFNIPLEDLMMYGWGLKLFTKVHTLAEARRRVAVCVNNLIQANLLIESDCTGCVKMHDLVRAFVLSNFSKVKQASLVTHDSISRFGLIEGDNCTYKRILLTCMNMSAFPLGITNHDNLSVLILIGENKPFKFPEDLYRRMKDLEVVSYERLSIPLLPMTLKHSINLRTLCLRSCSLINDDIYCLGDLSNLEELSFANSNLRRLPSTIGNLKKLKLLDLTGSIDLCIDDGVFQSLCSLEELYTRATKGRPVRFTRANCDELEKRLSGLSTLELELFETKFQPNSVSFKNLERFRISIGCQLEELKHEDRYSFTNTIKFIGDNKELLECKISDIFKKTEELFLEVKDMSYLEGSFPKLRVLHVSKCAGLKYLFTVAVTSGLKKLERLSISECPVLTSLVSENSGTEVVTFPMLNFISLTGLPKLVSMFDNVVELPEMMELHLDGLPNFTSIYSDNNTFEMQSLLNKKVVIPKLEELYIYRMENLKQIWPCEVVSTTEKNSASLLRTIIVNGCDSLLNLFPSNPLPLLSKLEVIEVESCGCIEVLFNMDVESVSGMEEYDCSRLKSIAVNDLDKLKELWRMRGENNSLVNGFKKVESIKIKRCRGFTNLFTPITTNFDLGALTYYQTTKVGEKIGGKSEGEISEVGDYIPNVTYPSYFLRTGHQLQRLHLVRDERVEEVVFQMDGEPSPLLPYLELVQLSGLKKMSHVWKCNNWNKFLHQPLQQFPFQNLTDIYLSHCDKIKYLFSPLMTIYLSNLKKVTVRNCESMEEVISRRDDANEENTTSTSSHQKYTAFFPHLEYVHLELLPRLKSIDSGDTRRSSAQFSNNFIHDQLQQGPTISACLSFLQYPTKLQVLNIDGCEIMMEVFMFSTLESLKQLKWLKVTGCKAMQVIVKEENVGTPSKVVVFPRLKILILVDLPNLKGFFLGMNEFLWPVLDDVEIRGCPQLMTFTTGHSNTPMLKHRYSSLGKHSVECGLNFPRTINQNALVATSSSDPTISKGMPWSSFHNLIEINRPCEEVGRSGTVIPSHALLQLQKLEIIDIRHFYDVKEVFEVVLLEAGVSNSDINESQNVVQVPNLKEVKLSYLTGLKYLWRSNQWMVLEFPNLTTISIEVCHSLEHVFTCSMVASLAQLQDLHIDGCKNIEVIVKEDKEECDGKVNEIIMLPRLKSLKISRLQRLKGFCLGKKAFSFPALDTLHIKKCPTVMGFTNEHLATPELKVIDTDFGMYLVTEDLNSFIKTKQQEGRFYVESEPESEPEDQC